MLNRTRNRKNLSAWGNVRQGCVWSGKCPSGKCPSGKCLVGELSVGEVSVGEVSGRGNVRRGCVRRKSVLGRCVRRGNVRRGTVRTPLGVGQRYMLHQKHPLEVFYNKIFLKNVAKFSSNFIKKETLTQVFSFTFCTKHLWTTASVACLKVAFSVIKISNLNNVLYLENFLLHGTAVMIKKYIGISYVSIWNTHLSRSSNKI